MKLDAKTQAVIHNMQIHLRGFYKQWEMPMPYITLARTYAKRLGKGTNFAEFMEWADAEGLVYVLHSPSGSRHVYPATVKDETTPEDLLEQIIRMDKRKHELANQQRSETAKGKHNETE